MKVGRVAEGVSLFLLIVCAVIVLIGAPVDTYGSSADVRATNVEQRDPNTVNPLTPPLPTPTPSPGVCFYVWGHPSPEKIDLGESVTYTLHIFNCSVIPTARNLRHVVILADQSMSYQVGSTGGDLVSPADEPDISDCTTPDESPEIVACSGKPVESLLLAYPSLTSPYGAGSQPVVNMIGGNADVLTFQLNPRSLSEKPCYKRYTSLVECKDANYSTTKSRLR